MSNTSVILGINAFHADSSACLVINGKLVAAIAEERLGKRIKHDPSFPMEAIKKVLEIGNVKLKEVTHIAINRDTAANKTAKIKYTLLHPLKSTPIVRKYISRRNEISNVWEQLARYLDEDYHTMHFKIVEVEHHLAHIASAYYLSPFDSLTAGFSYDGSGDFASMMAARCEGTKIDIIDRVTLPNSLGFFYSAICQFIGFNGYGEEYKVMGLAPYGEDKYSEEMKKLLHLPKKKWFDLEQKYMQMPQGYGVSELDNNGHIYMPTLYSAHMNELFAGKSRKRDESLTQREKDIAKSCQIRFEEAAIHCMNKLHDMVPSEKFAMAGGSALNGVANARILRETAFTTPYLQAAASDEGTCLGAAYWCYHNIIGGKERFHMEHAFWGEEFNDGEIKQAIQKKNLQATFYDYSPLLDKIVSLLTKGKIVGWFQGRSEWGPRALGHRSIIADPTNPNMKDIINSKIKRRESFRPFAPSVLSEKVSEYFEQDVYSPFMMHVVKFKKEWRDKLPAVVHVDGTGRLQSVARHENPKYYDLIKRFSETSGVSILLNTSFNENEPVVETPEEALNCFLRTDMDAICLENYIVEK